MKQHRLSRRSFLRNAALAAGTYLVRSRSSFGAVAETEAIAPARVLDQGFSRPVDLCFDAAGQLYVADAAAYCVKKLDASYETSSVLGQAGYTRRGLNYPQGVAVSASGEVFVADSNNGRIVVFSPEGEWLENRTIGTLGGVDGRFYQPLGLDFDPADNLFVADSRNQRIQVFDHSGKLLRVVGGWGTGDSQFRLADDVAVLWDGGMVVTDSLANKAKVFDAEGKFVRNLEVTLSAPSNLAVDGDREQLYLADTNHNRLLVFDKNLALIATIDGLKKPRGIALDGNGDIYVAEPDLKRIAIFKRNQVSALTESK